MQNLMGPARPLGVSIIAVLTGIQGVILIVLGILVLVGLLIAAPLVAIAGGWIPLILGILILLLAVGLWRLRRWAYWITLILEILSLLDGIASVVQSRATSISGWVSLVLAVIIILYMLSGNVRAAFGFGAPARTSGY